MDSLDRPLARHLVRLLFFILLLSLLASLSGLPLALAEAPRPATTPHPFLAQPTHAPSGPLAPPVRRARLLPASGPQAAPAAGRGYVPPPFDTSHLNDYPEPSPGLDLVSRWDWREQGKVTRVQNQGNCGSCYAFATLGSMEAQSLIRDGTRYDFSENNLAECNYEQTGCDGGNIWITGNRLSTYGAVTEACDPYRPADQACNTACPALLVASEVWVLGGNAVPNTDVLKGWLQTYGPLFVTIDAGTPSNAWGQEFSNYNGSYTLYHPTTSPDLNHAVLLVGWNDDLTHAGGSGAWVVKNSWGTSWGGTCGYGSEGGYFTIAYGSAGIGSNPALVRDWRPASSAGKLLYLDEGGVQGGVGWQGTYGPHGLARLTPQQGGSATHVEVWTLGPGSADIAIYDSFSGQAPSGLLWQRQGVSLGHAGYHSIAIDAPVAVQAGNDVYVQVRFNTTGVYDAIPVDDKGPSSGGQSFASLSGGAGSWVDLATLNPPLDIGIRLRVGGSTVTPTFTPKPGSPTPTVTPRPPTKTPTTGPSPVRKPVYLPLMLRQWTVTTAPTATHTPGPVIPTATPTEQAGFVYLLSNHLGYFDDVGGAHIVGEVQNDSGAYVSMIQVTAQLYAEDGAWLAEYTDYAPLDNLAPGHKTCFHLAFDPPYGLHGYELGPLEYYAGGEPSPQLEFTDHSGTYDPDSGWFWLEGAVRNHEAEAVEAVRVVGALYDENLRVMGCDSCYVDSLDLGPGESSTFGMAYTDFDYEYVAWYTIWAEAQWP